MSKKKIYAVKNGKKIGIFKTWDECKEQVNGYKGAEYKSFENEEDALNYINGTNVVIVSPAMPKKDEIYAYIDGSFNKDTNEYAYGIVIINSQKEIKTLSGKDNREDVASMRNVAGELKGAMTVVNYVVKNLPEIKKIRIYHDYEGIAKWVTGEWRTNLEFTTKYKEYMNKMKENIEISFEKVKAHTGVEYNEMADKLAKNELGIK